LPLIFCFFFIPSHITYSHICSTFFRKFPSTTTSHPTSWLVHLSPKFSEQFPNLMDMISQEKMQHIRKTCAASPSETASEHSERLYFAIGSALAARKEWISMTFRQLEHETRVQGLLGRFEKHDLSEWKLRLKLACEAKRIEGEEQEARKE
jgi:hypothetical protein